jgi:hypothetical protein
VPQGRLCQRAPDVDQTHSRCVISQNHPGHTDLIRLRDRLRVWLRSFRVNLSVGIEDRAPLAWLISRLYHVRSPSTLIVCSSERSKEEVLAVLRQVGILSTNHICPAEPPSRSASSIHLAVSDRGMGAGRPSCGHMVHFGGPASLNAYVEDIRYSQHLGRDGNSVVLTGSWDEAIGNDVREYCANVRCRHAQLVGMVNGDPILPYPREFCCYPCDVCLSEPRACFGDDTMDVVAV